MIKANRRSWPHERNQTTSAAGGPAAKLGAASIAALSLELSAAVELRRLFPGVTDNAQARECVRVSLQAGCRCRLDCPGYLGAGSHRERPPGIGKPGDLTLAAGLPPTASAD